MTLFMPEDFLVVFVDLNMGSAVSLYMADYNVNRLIIC